MRDILHVVGCNDKVFRYFATQIESEVPNTQSEATFEAAG